MKKLITFFGVLDIIYVVDGVLFHNLLFREISLNWFDIQYILMYTSLILSGYFLIRQKEIGLWISYIQFPFRLLLAYFSFGLLFLNNQHYLSVLSLTILLVILEIVRLVLSILIHRKFFYKSVVHQLN